MFTVVKIAGTLFRHLLQRTHSTLLMIAGEMRVP
jgi:hypothetical protein